MDDPGTATARAEPGRWTRLGVLTGTAKADLDHLWWVDEVTRDPAWRRRAALARTVPQLAVYGIGALVFDTPGFFVGAVIGMIGALVVGRRWYEGRIGRATRNLHGIGDKRSFWADWPAGLYAGFNLAMIVALVGIVAIVFSAVDDRAAEPRLAVAQVVDCDEVDGGLELSARVANFSGAPQRAVVEFRYVEAFGGDVVSVPETVTLSPDTWQDVVTSVEVGPDQGCFGVGATVRSAG